MAIFELVSAAHLHSLELNPIFTWAHSVAVIIFNSVVQDAIQTDDYSCYGEKNKCCNHGKDYDTCITNKD